MIQSKLSYPNHKQRDCGLFGSGYRDSRRSKYNETTGHSKAKILWTGRFGTRRGSFKQ